MLLINELSTKNDQIGQTHLIVFLVIFILYNALYYNVTDRFASLWAQHTAHINHINKHKSVRLFVVFYCTLIFCHFSYTELSTVPVLLRFCAMILSGLINF